MKKKIFNILLSICVIATMIIPVNIRAIEPQVEVTFAWNCGGNICASGLNLTRFNAGTNYFINKREAATFIDGGLNFNAAAASSYGKQNYRQQYYIFRETVIEEIKTKQTWEALDEAVHEGNGEFDINYNNSIHHIEAIDPCGGNDGPNSIVHNGDRDFRLIVYDNGYVPIKFDFDTTKYKYFLGNWEPIFANPTYDISKSTEENPLVYNTYLLEENVIFRMDGIKSVKALNVSNKGVNVQVVDNAIVNIKFNSNYFNEVTFEIELTNSKKHYLKVNRQFVRFADNSEEVMEAIMNNEPAVAREAYAEFIYPETDTYKNYDVYATYTVNGKTETKKLEAVNTKKKSNEGPFIEGMSLNAGVWLSSTRYKIDVTKDTEEVYITVTKKGATDGDVYGGTFGGNGKGTKLDISQYLRMLNDNGGRQ